MTDDEQRERTFRQQADNELVGKARWADFMNALEEALDSQTR